MNHTYPLTRSDLQRYTPSVFTNEAAHQTSDKYQFISTISIIDRLQNEGFVPVWAAQCRTRSAAKKEFTKHMLRFRHIDAQANKDGLYPELVLVNSHDGLSSYRLMAGIFRLICSNGLIAGSTANEIRVRHQGNILDNVIEGTYEVMNSADTMLEAAETMRSYTLNNQEKLAFAETAHSLRFEENSTLAQAITPERLLQPRRWQEKESDLFTVLNVVQENIIKGGVRAYGRDARGYLTHVTTRAVTGIDQNTSLNRALWTLAEKMAELKQAV